MNTPFSYALNRQSIYDMLFLNVSHVLEYPSIDLLRDNDEVKYKTWITYSEGDLSNEYYLIEGIKHPEFTKIVSIVWGNLYFDTEIKRNFGKSTNDVELLVISKFFEFLDVNKKEYILCGEDIINNDIPLLIKKFIQYKDDMVITSLPKVFKDYLTVKPWDSNVVDTRTLWKFNGYYNSTNRNQTLYSDFLGMKKNVPSLLTNGEISVKYWNSINDDKQRLMDVEMQSLNKVNLAMKLIDTLSLL